MFDSFKGKVAYKHANSIFLENEHHLKEIYVDEINMNLIKNISYTSLFILQWGIKV